MLDSIIASTRPHFPAIARLSVRDTELAAVTGALLCGLCWHVGHPVVAVVLALLIFTIELLLRLMFSYRWIFEDWDKGQMILLTLVLHPINTVLYSVPAIYLAGDSSFALKISGLMFAMGIQVYVANSWSNIPVFIYAILLPSMSLMALTFLQLTATSPEPSSMTHWAIATVTLFLFIYSAIETLRQNLRTQMELFNAERAAASRLTLLEDAHRQDTLTGLLNRPAFDRALKVMLDERSEPDDTIAVFFIDLDAFKPINDTYSHDAGDEMLVQTAIRIVEQVGQSGIAARLGGDEFICAVKDLNGASAVTEFAQELVKAIAQPVHWGDKCLRVTASVGAALTADGPLETVSSLCSAADQALSASKSSANGDPVLYSSSLFAPRMSARDKQYLIDGIKDQSVKPFYQPKIHLPTGQIIGFEALARWEHPSGELREPIAFVDQIDELGKQGDFMSSMARQVFGDVARMLRDGLDPGQVSLNISDVALATHSGQEDLMSLLRDNPEVAPHMTFEITENVFFARAADTIQAAIARFRDAGVQMSLDDFGTGFASFHHLLQLDLDELKIDTSFVTGLGRDPTAEVLVRGFVDISAGLGISVIAEGVETESQRRDLINMGCMTAQGFLFSAAMPIAEARALLSKQIPALV